MLRAPTLTHSLQQTLQHPKKTPTLDLNATQCSCSYTKECPKEMYVYIHKALTNQNFEFEFELRFYSLWASKAICRARRQQAEKDTTSILITVGINGPHSKISMLMGRGWSGGGVGRRRKSEYLWEQMLTFIKITPTDS